MNHNPILFVWLRHHKTPITRRVDFLFTANLWRRQSGYRRGRYERGDLIMKETQIIIPFGDQDRSDWVLQCYVM